MNFFSEASPIRKAVLGAGALAFVAGLILIAIAGISALGGGEDEPDIEVRDIQSPTPTAPATPTPSATGPATPTPPATPQPAPPLGQNEYVMVIDKLGVNAPVQTFGLDAQAVPEVPTGGDAAQVVAWYEFSAEPGTGSNAVFAGHVTWFGPGVFYSLTSMTAGDEIKLIGDNGKELVYSVNDVFQVDANDPDALQLMAHTDEDILTIITCDGAYTDNNDPIFGGEYSHRLVVRAELSQGASLAAAGG